MLLVEDEEALRRAGAEFLSLRGYTVLEASDGLQAMSVANGYGSNIDLMVTDVVMPHVSGGQLAKELAAVRPETRVLFVSGYAGQTVLDHKVVDVASNFLQKPFTLKQLAGKVRSVLASKAISAAAGSEQEILAHHSGSTRVSFPSFRRKRSPRQVTVLPPRLTIQTATPIRSRNGISHAWLSTDGPVGRHGRPRVPCQSQDYGQEEGRPRTKERPD